MIPDKEMTLAIDSKIKAAQLKLSEYSLGAMLFCGKLKRLNPQTIAQLLKN